MARRFLIRNMGNSLLFNGASNKVDCGADFIGANAGSISAWVMPRSFGGGNNGRIISNGKVELMISTPGRVGGDTDGGGTILSGASRPINNFGTWYFIVFTWNVAGLSNIYVDGVLSSSADVSNGAPVAGSTNLFIGGRSANDRGFNGNIDEVRIYNSVLTIDKVQDLYYSNIVPNSCIAEYLFNEGSGTSAVDTVGDHDGAISGATYSTYVPIIPRTSV